MGRDKAVLPRYRPGPMILSTARYYFWWFTAPTPLAPAEDRSA